MDRWGSGPIHRVVELIMLYPNALRPIYIPNIKIKITISQQ